MKKFFLIFSIFIFGINSTISGFVIVNSYFSILSISGNNYEFQIVSTMNAVCGSPCADMFMHPSSISADTIYLRVFYDISGSCASTFCVDYDTISFQNVYPNANVINISTGEFWEDPNNPGVYDSLWNIKDSSFSINPLNLNSEDLENATGGFSFYPNPTNGKLSIQGEINKLGNQIDIFDLTGRLVSKFTVSRLPTTLNLNNLSNGLYIVRMRGFKSKLRILKE